MKESELKKHSHEEHDECCYNEHEHEHACCGHEHEHEHHHDDCGCGHDHGHERHHDGCGCGHDHGHEHHHDGCGCGHDHGEEELPIPRLAVGVAVFIAAIILQHTVNIQMLTVIFYIAAYVLLGYDIVLNALKNIVKGHVFDENLLMSVASIGAFLLGDYPEAVSVMLFYRIGETLQDKAVDKSRKSITDLMDIRPDYANLCRNSEIITVSPEEVHKGDVILIKNGEKSPLDCIVTDGHTFMDTSALTGESVPREIFAGSEILSGFINTGSAIHAEVTKEYSDSTVARILEITENARDKKAHSEQFITKFARYYTPIVVAVAALLIIIPTIVTGDFMKWISRALIFLVVSCPCALVVSIPLSFFAGIGSASKKGILVKGSTYLEVLSKIKTAVFDKTGTLTKGIFEVDSVKAQNGDNDKLLEYAAYAECYSNHPVAEAILRSNKAEIDRSRIGCYDEIAGMGIHAEIDGKSVLCGNMRLMTENKIYVPQEDAESSASVYIAADGNYEGCITISDKEKEDSINAISGLTAKGIKTVMLTGDTAENANKVSEHLGITQTYSQLLPQDKAARMQQIMKNSSGVTAFVGDGINDAPVLAMADIGVAMGGLGSDSAIEAADMVLMTDEPSKLLDAMKISHKTMRIVKENIIFAIGVKVIIMLLGALGITGMWLAIFADVGVSLIAILNALRILR